jgi:uncharacterized membrane protein YkoI
MKKKLARAAVLVLFAVLVCSIAIAKKCHDKKASLPDQAKKSLTASYPGASIKEVQKDEADVKVFKVELALADGKEIDVTVADDGTIMETDNEIETSALPFDASKIIPNGGEIKEVESEVTYAVLAPVVLDQPKTTYNLEILVDGKKVELEVAADGTVLESKAKGHDDDENGDDDNGDDDDNDNGEDNDD